MQTWAQAQYIKFAEQHNGTWPSSFEQRNLRLAYPVPRNIGCTYGGGDAECESALMLLERLIS